MKLNSFSLQKIGALLYIGYVFFYDLIEEVAGRGVVMFMLFSSIFFFIASIVMSNRKVRFYADLQHSSMVPWFIFMFLFVIPRNQILIRGNYWLTMKWIVAAFVAYLITLKPGKPNQILKVLLTLGLVHVAATWFFFFVPSAYSVMYRIWGAWPAGTARGATVYKAGLTNHYSRNAIVIVNVMIVAAAYLLSSQKKEDRAWKRRYFVCFVFIVASLVLTTKRSSLLFGGVAIIVGYYVANPSKRSGRLFKTICVVFALAVAVELLSNVIPALGAALERFTLIGEDTSSTNRMLMWGLALRLFQSNPLIGIGWGGYKYRYYSSLSAKRGGLFDYLDAHNVYVQMLAETGIAGTILFLVALIGSLIVTVRLLKRRNELKQTENIALLYSLMYQVFIIFYCLTGNCFYDITVMHYMVAISLAFGINYRLYQESRINR